MKLLDILNNDFSSSEWEAKVYELPQFPRLYKG